jgi:hypothetical protein
MVRHLVWLASLAFSLILALRAGKTGQRTHLVTALGYGTIIEKIWDKQPLLLIILRI